MSTPAASPAVDDVIVGNGEVAALVRGKDWSRTPLGPIAGWPQSLRTAVNLCLASNFPVNVVWGPEHTQIYNDAYRVVFGDAHPRALGEGYRVTWASAWHVIGEAFDRALAGDTSVLENQRMVVTRNGQPEEAFFTFSTSPIRAEDGSVGGLFQLVTKAAGAGAAQKMETLGRLTGGVAHDFNNLMMVVSGAINVLERQPDAGRQRQALESMRRAVTRGTELTRQLLGVGGGPTLAPKPIDLPVCIGRMETLLNRTLGGKVRVVSQFPPDLWPVLADPGELELALLNLGINARDAMPGGGTVSITTENTSQPLGLPPGDYVRISVGDTGVGMTAEERARAFDASSAGLAQVHGFAEAAGGSAVIDSAPGLGTTVTLLVPRSRAAVQAPEAPKEQLSVQRQGRVLVVEDDNEVAELVAEMLEHLGYQLVRAGTAAEALFTLEHDARIDLVFSDVMMPGKLTGIDLARRVRHDYPRVRVVLTSGYAESFAQQARNEGLLLLPKPYAIDELSALMERALQARVH